VLQTMEPCGQGVWPPTLAAQCRCTSLPPTSSMRACCRASPNTSSSLVRYENSRPCFDVLRVMEGVLRCLCAWKHSSRPPYPRLACHGRRVHQVHELVRRLPTGLRARSLLGMSSTRVSKDLHLAPLVMPDSTLCIMNDSCWPSTTACTDRMSPSPSRRGTCLRPPMLLQAPTRSAWGAAKHTTSCWMYVWLQQRQVQDT
jgi:hypothetical protein